MYEGMNVMSMERGTRTCTLTEGDAGMADGDELIGLRNEK